MQKTDYSDAAYYEKIASTRWGRYIGRVEQQAVLAAHRHAATPSILLDVGAAGGRWSQILSGLGWRPICTDVNEKSLAVCQSRLPNATCILVNESDRTLPVEDHKVDLILCMAVFAVMPTSWFLKETIRVLKPGGLVVGEFNNRCSLRGLFKHALHVLQGSNGVDYYNACYKSWKRQWENNGFEFIQEDGICWMPFSISSDSRLVTPLVELERLLRLGRLPNSSPRIVFVARRRADMSVAGVAPIKSDTGLVEIGRE